jgi:hypothetical protein
MPVDSKFAIEGVIEKKYIQTHNHLNRVLEIRLFSSEIHVVYLSKGPHEDFFEYASVNDTVSKNANSLTYHVKKSARGQTCSFFIHRGCPDSLSLPR